ncbi:hypothetical protein HYH03_005751 [Edaphochlamys debaryana]|uniref:Uncharacterized protein n=1 Tax=Edaphochlamys debaryana TaxID=47281 RepID=A0A836C232_9CHLO|nr:hypothetical protein HYH03_005751 [Edaphochlamys debaryana]|eukprot:KAG2496149.1 hypothetical protein HYH03_005751 [Edaphochlamys debaryana]
MIGATFVVEDAGVRQALHPKLAELCLLATLDPWAGEAAAGCGQVAALVIQEGVQVLVPLRCLTPDRAPAGWWRWRRRR